MDKPAVEDSIEQISNDVMDLTDLTAQRHVELQQLLQTDISSLEVKLKKAVENVAGDMVRSEQTYSKMLTQVDDKMHHGVAELIKGTLQAALVPLAEAFEERMADFEAKVVSVGGAG